MTPAELAQQQLQAAWVSAIAAGVQAAGAIGAIIAAVVLGQKSAKREQAARRASEERERRADQAAERRAREADEAADRRVREADEAARRRAGEQEATLVERERRRRDDEFNETVDRAAELGSRCTDLAAENAAYWERLASSGDRTSYGSGSLDAPAFRDAVATLRQVADLAPPDPDLRAALAVLLNELNPPNGVNRTFGQATVQARAVRGMELTWRTSVARVRALRRGPASSTIGGAVGASTQDEGPRVRHASPPSS